MRIAVDGLPPDGRPSGAGRARGTRVRCRLFTPSRGAPHRGRASPAGRSTPRGNSGWTCHGRARWRPRALRGHGPQTRTPCPRDGDDHLVGVVPSGAPLSVAGAPSSLGLPTDIVERLGPLLQASRPMPADVGGVAIGPGAFDQRPAGRAVARRGEAARSAPRSRRVCRRCYAPGVHERSGVIAPGAVAAFGPGGHGDRAWHPASGLERVDDRGPPPGLPLVAACLVQPCSTCRVFRDRAAVVLAHERRRRWGTDDRAAPPEGGRPPGGAAGVTASRPQAQGVEPTRRGRESADGICTPPAQVPPSCIVHRGNVDGGEVARAPPSSPCDGSTTVGLDAIPGLVGDQGGRPDPTAWPVCVSERSSQDPPGPASSTKMRGWLLDCSVRRR